MQPKCADAVKAVAAKTGHKVSNAKFKEIEELLSDKMKHMAYRDVQAWRGLTRNERISAAKQEVMADIKAAADRKVANAERQILAQVQTGERLDSIKSGMRAPDTVQAWMLDLNNAHLYNRDIKDEMLSGLQDLIVASGDKKGAGVGRALWMAATDAGNPAMTRDIWREIYAKADGHTGNEAAKLAAKAWIDVADNGRRRFNAAGGDIGQLDYGYIPRRWDADKIKAMGADGFADKMLPLMDRRRYMDEDGARLDDAQMRYFLKGAWETLRSEGVSQMQPGDFHGAGKRANRGAEHRTLHLKDGDAEMAAFEAFSRGSMYEGMIGHLDGLSRNIGMVERFGPDPSATNRLMLDLMAKEKATPVEKLVGTFAFDPRTRWKILSGETGTPANESLANGFQTVRNVQTFGKLGGAVITSLTDLSTMIATTGIHNIPIFDALKNAAKLQTKEARDWMLVQRFVAESVAGEMNRYSGDFLGSNWSGQLANATMKLGLLNRWTDSMRGGFIMSLSAKLADMVKTDWAVLDKADRNRMLRAGLTEDDWKVFQNTELAHYGDTKMLTPAAVKDAQAANRLGAFMRDEGEYAVINPDMATKVIQTFGGMQAGTASGEIARTVMQFKSFPIAMVSRHWARMMEMEGSDRSKYGFSLFVSATIMGAMVTQIKQLLGGKDPIDMQKPKFWAQAVMQGGALSIAGDLLLTDSTQDRGKMDLLGRFALGPTGGSVADLLELTKGNIDEYLAGKNTNAGAETLQFAKGHTPGVSLWWVKPWLERGVLHGMQENLSPGYLQRMQSKARHDWGQEYWWKPGEMGPANAPDFAKAVGQ